MHLAMKFEMLYGDREQYQLDGEVWGMQEEGTDEVWYMARIFYSPIISLDHQGRVSTQRERCEFVAMANERVKKQNSKPYAVATRAYQRMMRQRPNRADVEKDVRLWAEKMKMRIVEARDLEARAVA